jgi:hypothetical protein
MVGGQVMERMVYVVACYAANCDGTPQKKLLEFVTEHAHGPKKCNTDIPKKPAMSSVVCRFVEGRTQEPLLLDHVCEL